MSTQDIQLLYFKEREELDKIITFDLDDEYGLSKAYNEAIYEDIKRRGYLPRRVVKKKLSELISAIFNNWSATC